MSQVLIAYRKDSPPPPNCPRPEHPLGPPTLVHSAAPLTHTQGQPPGHLPLPLHTSLGMWRPGEGGG